MSIVYRAQLRCKSYLKSSPRASILNSAQTDCQKASFLIEMKKLSVIFIGKVRNSVKIKTVKPGLTDPKSIFKMVINA